MNIGYDIIGDVHGMADALKRLLDKLGYEISDGVYQHPASRKAIFVGDLIDRGPDNIEVIEIAKSMTEAGNAITIMGNHELNAIMYFRSDNENKPIRPHSNKNKKQHQSFLSEVEDNPLKWRDIIEWFERLPLFYENDDFRVIHACWDDISIKKLHPYINKNNSLKSDFILDAGKIHCELYKIVETLLKGDEQIIPNDGYFVDKDGNVRKAARIQWWMDPGTSFKDLAMIPGNKKTVEKYKLNMPNTPPKTRVFYNDKKPVFIGHYWMKGDLKLQTDFVCCVDYSAGKGDRLCAYRWNPREKLTTYNLATVLVEDST